MSITKPRKSSITSPIEDEATETFINAAPDGGTAVKNRNRKQQISLTISPDMLEKVDKLADKLGQSRASVINLAISQLIERGFTLERIL